MMSLGRKMVLRVTSSKDVKNRLLTATKILLTATAPVDIGQSQPKFCQYHFQDLLEVVFGPHRTYGLIQDPCSRDSGL